MTYGVESLHGASQSASSGVSILKKNYQVRVQSGL